MLLVVIYLEKAFVVEWLNWTQRHNKILVAIALRQTQGSKINTRTGPGYELSGENG